MDMTKPMAGMDHSKMDMTKPMAGMDHSKMGGPKIPISDGSSAVYIPAPYPEAVHFMDDPMIISAKADRLDFYQKETDKYPVSFEGNIWVGKDINKFEISAEIESDGDQIEELQSHAFYRRAISPYWDAKVGIRHDSKPKDRTYAMFGFTGLAPYNVEIDTALYVGKHGQAAAKFFAEKEFSFNRKTTLIPEIEVNFYKNNDPEVGIGSGLSDLTASLRLQYAITPNISPYIGVSWEKKFGNTAKYAEAEGEKTSDAKAFIGIQAWY
jgi:copper resistance protein B